MNLFSLKRPSFDNGLFGNCLTANGLTGNALMRSVLLCGSLTLTLSGCQQLMPSQNLSHQTATGNMLQPHSAAPNLTLTATSKPNVLNNNLSLTDNQLTDKQRTDHQRTDHQPPIILTEITWQQVLPSDTNRSGDTAPRPLVQNRPYLRFNQHDQRFSGNDGCNQIMGSYQARANTLTLSAIASTRRACLSGDDLNNGGFVHALNATQFYQFEQDQLILLDHKQQILLTFSKSITQ